MPEFENRYEHDYQYDDPEPRVDVPDESHAKTEKAELVAELKQEYRQKLESGDLTLNDLKKQLADFRREIADIEEEREPYNENPFIMESVLRDLVEETSGKAV